MRLGDEERTFSMKIGKQKGRHNFHAICAVVSHQADNLGAGDGRSHLDWYLNKAGNATIGIMFSCTGEEIQLPWSDVLLHKELLHIWAPLQLSRDY